MDGRLDRTEIPMGRVSRGQWFFGAWVVAVVLVGAVLTSYHQPFLVPEANALQIALLKSAGTGGSGTGRWRTTHLLSGGCGCSRRVMLHLLQRRPIPGVFEQVVMVDDEAPLLDGTEDVLASLKASGFLVFHMTDKDVPASSGVHGVPLLLITSPEGKVSYMGGYGSGVNRDEEILRRARSGSTVAPLPVLGCAVGSRAQKSSDPFRLKY